MGTHPDSSRRDVAQDRVELGPVVGAADRIDPDQNTVSGEESGAHVAGGLVGVAHELGRETDPGERVADRRQSRRRVRRERPVATAPQHHRIRPDGMRPSVRARSGSGTAAAPREGQVCCDALHDRFDRAVDVGVGVGEAREERLVAARREVHAAVEQAVEEARVALVVRGAAASS